MENQITLFKHEQFGKIRVIMIDGEPWFVAADACRILELRDVSKAIKRLDAEEKSFAMIPAWGRNSILTQGGEQNMLIVNEPGLYRLIFASRKKEARDFQHWVYHVVLPSIRKTGSYSLFAKSEPVVERKCHAIFPGYACVYVLLMSDDTVKIGFSGNPRARVAKIKRDSKLTVNDLYISPFMPREVARLIEWACQEKFSSRRMEGEFFSVKFETACAAVNVFVSAVNILSSAFKHYIATKKFLADKNSI